MSTVRTNISLPNEMYETLASEAKHQGVPMAALIRECIVHHLAKGYGLVVSADVNWGGYREKANGSEPIP